MLHLLKIEWMKVKNYRTFWVLSVLYLLSIGGANYLAIKINNSATSNTKMATALLGSPFAFPDVWQTVAWISSWLMFLPGLLMIISLTNEYSFKTHRQNIIDGLSRFQFISVKIMLAFIIALVSTLTVFITAVVVGINLSDKPFSFEGAEYVFYFFVQAFSYASLALLISLLFKRSGIAIGVYFLYSIFLENVLMGLMNQYLDKTGNYLPLQTTDNLVPIPLSIVRQFMPTLNVSLLLFLSAVYLALYLGISIRKFKTDDL